MSTTYAITITGEQTDWKQITVAQYDAKTERAALNMYYSDYHYGASCELGGIFKITHMTIEGTRYTATPITWVAE